MSLKKQSVVLGVLLIASMVLTACPAPAPQVVEKVVTQVVEKEVRVVETQIVETEKVVEVQVTATPAPVAGSKVLRLNSGTGDIPTIDPALAVDVRSVQIIDETTVGLVRQNEETAAIEPGMASSWDVSPDGLTYTFNLRDDVPWVRWDGEKVAKVQDCEGKDRMVTADDFAYGILRTLNPDTASDYAYVLGFAIEGADEYNTATITDTAKVAVTALDPKTLEVKVKEPAVYNTNILGLWVAHAQPKWLIEGDDCTEARGQRWTETGFFQGYGPYTLKEWIHDSSITIVKNPFWPGADNIPVSKIDEIHWVMLDTGPAFAEFEAGNLDASAIPLGDMDRVKADPQYTDWIVSRPSLGTEFYSFNTRLEPTDDARVRKALSLAIDRKTLVDEVNKGSGEPAQWFCRPGVTACPTLDKYPDLGAKYDPTKAKELLEEYLKEKGTTADKLNITLMFNTSDAHKRRAEAVQQMWKDTLGVNVQLANQEWKVFLVQRKEGNENIYRSSWVQDYPDANNFLREVFAPNGAYFDVVDWENVKFTDLVLTAALETDLAKRTDLYAQADKILVEEDAVIAPLFWYNAFSIYQPYVKHTDSITEYDYYEKWDIEK